jgi:hypothetical protein
MCRAAGEVRIFPLLEMTGKKSAFVEPVTSAMHKLGFCVSVEKVNYEFQRGANEMMRIRR